MNDASAAAGQADAALIAARAELLAAKAARNHLYAGLFFGLWAAVGWYSIRSNPQIAGVDFGSDPGPGLLPSITLTILTLGALALIVTGLIGRARTRPVPVNWPDELRALIGPVLLCLALAIYLPLVRFAGFIPGTALFAAALMAAQRLGPLRVDPKREGLQILVGTLVCVGLTWGLFIYWIGVSLG